MIKTEIFPERRKTMNEKIEAVAPAAIVIGTLLAFLILGYIEVGR